VRAGERRGRVAGAWLLGCVVTVLLAGPAASPAACDDAASERSFEELVRDADAAFTREDHPGARALYEQALRLDPKAIHPLRRLALLQSWSGELRSSIATYRRALTLLPGDFELSLGLARVLSWNHDLSESIRIYRELRQTAPADPRVLLGLGQALSWRGRYAEADAVYRDMEDRKIEPIQAHLGRARILGWQGRLDEALTFYRDVMRADPGNLEARVGLARVHHWQGLDRAALAQADNVVLDHPENAEAKELREAIRLSLHPRAELEASRSNDSDSNRVDGATATCTFMAEPQTSVRIAYSAYRAEFRCEDAGFCDEPGLAVGEVVGTDAQVVTGGLTSRIVGPLTFHARAGAAREETFNGGTRLVAVGGGFLRWQVGPRFAMVGNGGREAMLDTAPLIDRGLRVDTADVRLEHRFRPAWLLSGGVGYGSYSDGNARQSAGAAIEWRLPRANPWIAATFDVRYRGFNVNKNNGYFDPLRYQSELLTMLIWDDHQDGRITWRVEGTYGRQDFDLGLPPPSDDSAEAHHDTVQAVSGTVAVGMGPRATLEAFYSRSDYALQVATGFVATRAGFTLRIRM
jgi:tetratricopeptide (TPR) repeat protein